MIEPFAGSMAYTMHYRPSFAIGVESNRPVVDLWHRLTSMSRDELKSFPAPVFGERTTDLWHLLAAGGASISDRNYRTVNDFMVVHFERSRRLALRHYDYARERVLYAHGDYTSAPDVEATWFIDPPYERIDGYRHRPDYNALARWVKGRRGQVIVCEGGDADWLDFTEHAGLRNGLRLTAGVAEPSHEVVWMHDTTRPCDRCGDRFDGRADARFCSTRCRVAAHRALRVAPDVG